MKKKKKKKKRKQKKKKTTHQKSGLKFVDVFGRNFSSSETSSLDRGVRGVVISVVSLALSLSLISRSLVCLSKKSWSYSIEFALPFAVTSLSLFFLSAVNEFFCLSLLSSFCFQMRHKN